MTVRPILLASLARRAGQGLTAADRLARHPAVRGRVTAIEIPPFGKISLTCTTVTEPRPPDDGDVVWALSRPGDERLGFLMIDGWTALRIVAGTLGLPLARSVRALGAAERGIATATIAGILRSAGTRVSVMLGSKAWNGTGLARLVIAADPGNSVGRVQLDIHPDWLADPGDSAWLADATALGLEIPLRIVLARTTLTAADWSRARAGDAVVFDDHDGRARVQQGPAWLICGRFAAQVLLGAEGMATLITEFQPLRATGSTSDLESANTANKETEAMLVGESPPDPSLTMLAAAPIEVVAEIGRIVMRADEITALRPGSVLTLGSRRLDTVELTVGDRVWALGDLVDVDGQLGVRLTSVAWAP
jgi:type III secretion system YscQ/HrcQ family protein